MSGVRSLASTSELKYDRKTLEFDQLYEQYAQMIYATCLTYSRGRPEWAEDAAHDVFVKVFERIDQLDPDRDPGPWLHRIAVNHCLNVLEREGSIWGRVRSKLVGWMESAPSEPSPEEKTIQSETIERLFGILDELPPKERAVFVMRYLEDKDPVEICETLDISKGYCSKLLARARERIEKNIEV